MDVRAMIEDEILLGLPLSPRHPDGACSARSETCGAGCRVAVGGLAVLRNDNWMKQRSCEMAVQQNKKSPSKRGMHRSHDRLYDPPWR